MKRQRWQREGPRECVRLYIPTEIKEALRVEADKYDMSMSRFVAQTLAHHYAVMEHDRRIDDPDGEPILPPDLYDELNHHFKLYLKL